MKLAGWGRSRFVDADVQNARAVLNERRWPRKAIARGFGRSYGDAAVGEAVVATKGLDRFREFNENTGELVCESGVSLADIVDVFLPRGWFLPVTPGTKYVSVGGAIASDVHGKNHHRDGCFSEFVSGITLMLPDGSIVECGRERNPELFRATCGGMGLTGLIVEARIRLIPVPGGKIAQRTLKARSLLEAMEQFERHATSTYTVAWIDCLATGSAKGRSLLYLGEHCEGHVASASSPPWKGIPFDMPSFALNAYTTRLFNQVYYAMGARKEGQSIVDIDPFFYPLDAVRDWNRMYGRKGFFQYQCVIPLAASKAAFDTMLARIAAAGRGSFLAVLKRLGPANDNLLSFPMEGYTLALDFPNDPASLRLMLELDRIVADHEGRIYLAKDARMSPELFRNGYPAWGKFLELRRRTGAKGVFESDLSERLGI